MAIGSTLRGNGPKYYEPVSPEELFAHFSGIQATGLIGFPDDRQPELNIAVDTLSQ